jgi:hypothetical protein
MFYYGIIPCHYYILLYHYFIITTKLLQNYYKITTKLLQNYYQLVFHYYVLLRQYCPAITTYHYNITTS